MTYCKIVGTVVSCLLDTSTPRTTPADAAATLAPRAFVYVAPTTLRGPVVAVARTAPDGRAEQVECSASALSQMRSQLDWTSWQTLPYAFPLPWWWTGPTPFGQVVPRRREDGRRTPSKSAPPVRGRVSVRER